MHNLSLFPTPVTIFDLPGMEAINREATDILLAESRTVPSLQRSNVGGWHSPNLAIRPEACFQSIFTQIRERVAETMDALAKQQGSRLPPMRIGIYAWAMVMRTGDYTMPHDHADVHWATVYYPDAGEYDESAHPESGMLTMMDPRHGSRSIPGLELVGSTFSVHPRSGRLVVFPGWLMHYVHAYRGARPRVAISCNCAVEPLAQVANERVSAARR